MLCKILQSSAYRLRRDAMYYSTGCNFVTNHFVTITITPNLFLEATPCHLLTCTLKQGVKTC